MELVERYTKRARWFHWLIAVTFIELVISGMLIFIPWITSDTIGSVTRILHRVGAVVLVGAPLLYAIFDWRGAWEFIKEGLTWGKEDLEWLKAAPGYYFGGDPRMMPPQGYINTGMKLYRVAIFGGAAFFVITGLIMWFFKGIVPVAVFQWCLVIHDVTFIVAICMFLLHFQLGVFHPRMDESILSMYDGKVSGMYARSHHGKWYEKVAKNNDKESVSTKFLSD
jgi:formate dehydrogenase subunit gamma